MRFKLILAGLVLAASSVSSTQAQVTIDATKVTCDQFVQHKVGSPRMIGAWLSGFYNGKRDNRFLSLQDFEARLEKLEQFCYGAKNVNLPVMQAVEELFGASK